MIRNLKLAKVFWFITTVFAFSAALGGVLVRGLYTGLFPADFLPGAFPQDVLTLLVCVALGGLIATTRESDVKRPVIILGLLGSLFYLYGIFTIERVYNAFYLLYAAVFASSFWSMVYSLAGFKPDAFERVRLTGWVLKLTAVSSLVIAVLFTGLWTAALIPLMRDHDRIDFLYSIYILDLCFVMPAFFITAVMCLRRMPLGILMAPAILITGFFVIFPLGLNELAKAWAGLAIDVGAMTVSFVFAVFMLGLAVLHLASMQIEAGAR